MANRHGLIAGATGTGKTITMKVMAESFSDLGVPCLYGLPMGHTRDQAALPLGVKVRLDADAKTFEILESGVTE